MIIQTDDLSKRFHGRAVVDGLRLEVPEGATYALVGANGAGKTTTLRMLVNLLRPDRGTAQVLGVDSRRLTYRELCDIAYVSEAQQLPDGLSVAHFFDYVRRLYPNWDAGRERELRTQFELPPRVRIGALSYGMRTKLTLAAALAFRPKLLLLDEPLSGLDPLVRDEVMTGLLGQAGETTIVISSHELAEIEGCTTHVAFIAKGRLLLQESIESLRARFREVSVTLPPGAPAPQPRSTWLTLQSHGAVTRFVDAAFDNDEELRSSLAAHGGVLQHFEALPMSLRDIAKTLMRANRAEQQT